MDTKDEKKKMRKRKKSNSIIKDPSYEKNINQARKYGIPVGSYHFLSKAPALPGTPHYDIWQFHRHGRVPGIWNWVDLNKFADSRCLEDIKLK